MKTAEEILRKFVTIHTLGDVNATKVSIKVSILQAMEEYSKENLREEYIQFLDWNKYSTSKRIVELINFDEYLKQKQ